jgi:hypothetical protein
MNIHEIYRPVLRHFRSKRMGYFVDRFQPRRTTTIIDVGGYTDTWRLIVGKPRVVLANRDAAPWDDASDEQFSKLQADGRQLPFPDRVFDIAFSNSVIEHVGGRQDQCAFATEIRRVALAYYVQTPNRWFPVEPHLITPVIHWLPRRLLRRLVRWTSLWGWMERPDQTSVDAMLEGINLLSRKDLAAMFPDAEIVIERFCGLPKSLIAMRTRRPTV